MEKQEFFTTTFSSTRRLLWFVPVFSLLFFLRCSRERENEIIAPHPETYSTADVTPVKTSERPAVLLTDVTELSGIHFVHENGYTGDKYLPETMGAGGGFFDYNNDGLLDILLVNGRKFAAEEEEASAATLCLYRNNGEGLFSDVTAEARLNVSLYGMGCTAADYDGDGDVDLFITAALDGNRLFRNDGGVFTDMTEEAGLVSPQWTDKQGRQHNFWSTSAAFFDADNDGWLDLFVCNYVEWSLENDIFTTRVGLGKSFTIPDLYHGQTSLFYRNRGNGTFENATQAAGVFNPDGKSLGVSVYYFNDDGWLDLAVANDSHPNFLYINKGRGVFEDRALDAGIAYDEQGRVRAGMGIDTARVFAEDIPSIAIGNFSHESISFYTQVQPLFFTDAAGRARISRPSLLPLTFGLIFFDYDLDGHLDIAAANGHIEPEIGKIEQEVTYQQPPQLFWNAGDLKFEDISSFLGDGFRQPMVGRGVAYGDVDNDGDLDLLFTQCGGPARLFRNDDAKRQNHWIRFKLESKSPNRDAIGAKVKLTTNNQTQTRMVRTGSSYLSQSELQLTFGLGKAGQIDALEIRWPGGLVQTFTPQDLATFVVNRLHHVVEP